MIKQRDWKTASVAIICLLLLEIYALSQGYNGVLLAVVIATIAGLAGYRLNK